MRSSRARCGWTQMKGSCGVYGLRTTFNDSRATRDYAAVFAQRTETRAKLFGEKLRLFPTSEMTAFFHLVVVDEIGIGSLRPVSGRLIEFIGKTLTAVGILTPLGLKKA